MLKQTRLTSYMVTQIACFGVVAAASAANEHPAEVILFKNVNIFDGVSDQLKMGFDVLVVRAKIHKIARDSYWTHPCNIACETPAYALLPGPRPCAPTDGRAGLPIY